MRHLKWLAVVAVLAAWPAIALAQRPADAGQRVGLHRAFDATTHGHPVPQRCLTFVVSTAAPGWGNVTFDGRHLARGCIRYGFNGATIFHFTRGRWRLVTEGSSFVGSNGRCSVPHVPMRVARDLKLC